MIIEIPISAIFLASEIIATIILGSIFGAVLAYKITDNEDLAVFIIFFVVSFALLILGIAKGIVVFV
jgi:hypothetical protein